MYTPHTVTLYNVATETDPETFDDVTVNHITVLRGVFLDANKGTNVVKSGLDSADAATLYIPFSVEAVDGITGEAKRYVGNMEFWRTDDKAGLWTLGVGRNTFFVKGEVVEPDKNLEYIAMAYDNVYTISKVDTKDFGSPALRHFECGCV